MNTKRIYIAGKVTGQPIADVRARFHRAECRLIEKGHRVINPVSHIEQINSSIQLSGGMPWHPENDWKTIMRICIGLLMDCDAIYLLSDWQQSKGALLEAQIAKAFGMEIMHDRNTPLKAMNSPIKGR